MSGFLPPAVFEIKAIANEAIAKFGEVNKELDKMGKNADTAGGKISGLDKASKIATAGLLALGTAFVGFAAYGIKEAMQAEQALTALGTTMSNVGVNTEANRAKVEALTKSYIDLGFADEDAAGAFNTLLRATGDMTAAQDLMGVSADYARVKHISMADASAVMAKASQGSVKAFKEMGISLDTTLPKSQAVAKAFDELKGKIGGQASAYTKTFAGQMAVMKAQFDETAQTLGTALLPILVKVMEGIRSGVKFIKEHSTAFKILGGIILGVAGALATYNVVTKTMMALEKAKIAIMGVSKTVMALVTGQQLAMNTAMELNPIGLIVAAVGLLVAGFVLLWNKSEPFRKLIINIGKAGVMAFGFIIEMVGLLVKGLLMVVTGPMKLLLKGLSLLGVDAAGKALDGINKMTDGVDNFFKTAADKVKGVASKLDVLNKPIKIPLDFSGGKIPETPNGKGGKGSGGLAGADKAAAIATAKKNNEQYQKDIKEFQDKVAKAQTKFNDAMVKADTDYNDTVAKLRADAAEKIGNLNKKAEEERLKLKKDYDNKVADAQKKFNDEMGKLNAKRAEDLAKAEEDHIAKLKDITESGNQKLLDIVQNSMDRLRNAYAKGTEVNVADLFKGLADAGTQSADGLLNALKNKLSAAKDLMKNAAKLQALGFSQTFIEQVVASGPEVGNQMAKSLQDASPETIKELQATYADMENTTNTGMDALATAMNSGGKLATEELNKAYSQAQKDMAKFLADEQRAYTAKQAEINKAFNENMAQAEQTRTTALADAKAAYDEALAQTEKDLQDAIAAVNKDLSDGLAQAAKELADAQAAARKDLADSLAQIWADYQDKMGKIQDANAKTIASINALKLAMASAGAGGGGGSVSTSSAGSVTSYAKANTTVNTSTLAGILAASGGTHITTNVAATTNATPASIATSVTNAVKYGTTVTSVNTSQGVTNKLNAGKYASLVD